MAIDHKPEILRTVNALRKAIASARSSNHPKIALIPTMGALHRGHTSLVEQVQNHDTTTIVSIFVNPTQFSEGEDFDSYPKTFDDDYQKLSALAVDYIYAPEMSEIYPSDAATQIIAGGVAQGLCATERPHFFNGVSLIVAKLLLQTMPDIAIFGEKDYQQLCVIKQLVRDLNIPTHITSGATIRESDGLALSSRNQYLSDEERNIAAHLNKTLQEACEKLLDQKSAQKKIISGILDHAKTALLNCGFDRVEYIEFRTNDHLQPVTNILSHNQLHHIRILAAAHIGRTRLIDNMSVIKMESSIEPKSS